MIRAVEGAMELEVAEQEEGAGRGQERVGECTLRLARALVLSEVALRTPLLCELWRNAQANQCGTCARGGLLRRDVWKAIME